MKVYFKIVLILLFVILVLLAAKAYQEYVDINEKSKNIALNSSKALSGLVISYYEAYYNYLLSNKNNKTSSLYYDVFEKIGEETFHQFAKFNKYLYKIKIIQKDKLDEYNLTNDEKKVITYLQKSPNVHSYIFEYKLGRYIFGINPLDRHKEKVQYNSFIIVYTNNESIKQGMYHEFVIEIIGNFLFAIALFALFYITLKEAHRKDEIYMKKLQEEVSKKTQDIEKKNEKITHQLFNDTLTNMPNRNRLLLDILENEEDTLALALINIDNFKEINDFYGHEIGDEVLISFAGFLRMYLEKFQCNIYKLHADEYAIVWHDSDKNKIESNIQDITNNTKNFIVITEDDYNIEVTATVGIAINTDSILSHADMVLKRAKKKQLPYLIFDNSMEIEKEYQDNITWTKKLKQAIKDDKIVAFCQPIAYLHNKKISKYEILVRLVDENENIISPFHFLNIAKKNKLYPYITKTVITKSFEKFNNTDYNFSINLSILDMLNSETVDYVIHYLKNYSNPSLITFEILESEGIENYTKVLDFIEKIKSYGCKIAIDDFGAGYSNFEYLLNLQVDLIKIDASLIKNIDHNLNAQIIVQTIVSFANNLGIETCAEFVHSHEVYEKLLEIGVTYIQGYYLSEPFPIDKLQTNPKI